LLFPVFLWKSKTKRVDNLTYILGFVTQRDDVGIVPYKEN